MSAFSHIWKLSHPTASHLIDTVVDSGLTYLGQPALMDLYRCVSKAETTARPGVLIEAGCALGGSAIVMAAAKKTERSLLIYDVFGMIPPPSDNDDDDVHERYRVISSGSAVGISGHRYYGYESDLKMKVIGNFSRCGYPVEVNAVQLVEGLFQDTLHPPEQVAVAHIDGDWYDSVMICLQRLTPRLVRGGVMIVDDYNAWSGCRKAVDDYFAGRKGEFEFVQRSRLHIVRK